VEVRRDVVIEPRREIPVAKRAEVLVVGGSPTGVAAAVAAARNGADVLLVERYGILGGQTTAGQVFTHGKRLLFDGSGRRIVAGINWEMIQRALDWGGAEPAWKSDLDWNWHGTWVDPEILKLVLVEMLDEAGVRLLLHSFVAGAIVEGGQLRGVIVENKSGRQAILAHVTVDATGDGDVAAAAGAPFESRGKEGFGPGLHSTFGQVDIERVLQFLDENPDQFRSMPVSTVQELRDRTRKGWSWGMTGFYDLVTRAMDEGVLEAGDARRGGSLGFLWMRDDLVQVWSIGPGIGIDALDVDDLTRAELRSRRRLGRIARFFQMYVPGFESATLVVTPVQIGVRETRRIRGEYVLTEEDVLGSARFSDAITLCAGHDQADRVGKGVGVPYRCLVPLDVDNLLVAGRCISVDAPTALDAVRGIIGGVSTGEAAGTAAALALRSGLPPRQVDVPTLRKMLTDQGVILDSPS
jgi:2-polyprenyl-6-methoxyphenol hydroxylase-like FAD-dependent oxidoreductase